MSGNPELSISLGGAKEVEGMIDSGDWWIFIGTDEVYDEIENRFYPNAFHDHSFLTVLGPPPRQLAGIDPDCRIMALHFGRKDKLPASELDKFFRTHHAAKRMPAFEPERDIIFIQRT
jgi:hypothetical protein